MKQEPDIEYISRLADNINRPLNLLFFLLPGFPIYALIPAVESLRIANQNTGEMLFRWKMTGSGTPLVRAGADMTLSMAGHVAEQMIPDIVFIFAGNEPTQRLQPEIISWLKKADRSGCFIIGVDTGVFAMAEAGILKNHIVTLHWEAIPLFRECYPDIQITEKLYLADGNIITCAGGMAVLDMMLEIIRIRHGDILAHIVAGGFVYSRWRPATDSQRTRGTMLVSNSNTAASGDVLSAILRTMEENLAPPLTPIELADRFNMSRRTLERLFRKHVGDSVGRYYMRLRIDMARDFLFYSHMDVTSVAIACGFSSHSHFTSTFQKIIGITPTEFLRLRRTERISPYRPRTRYHLDAKSHANDVLK
jgi:AraC family carnitine catabolism transcriptional activator